MSWTDAFAVFLVSHAVGDFVLQTNWQATHKHGGLGPDPVARRALVSHGAMYLLAFVPALAWLTVVVGPWAAALGVLIVVPHVVQDDGRLLDRYSRAVKKVEPHQHPSVQLMLDQSLHLTALFGVALLTAI